MGLAIGPGIAVIGLQQQFACGVPDSQDRIHRRSDAFGNTIDTDGCVGIQSDLIEIALRRIASSIEGAGNRDRLGLRWAMVRPVVRNTWQIVDQYRQRFADSIVGGKPKGGRSEPYGLGDPNIGDGFVRLDVDPLDLHRKRTSDAQGSFQGARGPFDSGGFSWRKGLGSHGRDRDLRKKTFAVKRKAKREIAQQ